MFRPRSFLVADFLVNEMFLLSVLNLRLRVFFATFFVCYFFLIYMVMVLTYLYSLDYYLENYYEFCLL